MSQLEKLIEIFTPFDFMKKKRIIGEVFFFPIKLIAALSISIFIYIYLTVFWINYTQGLK